MRLSALITFNSTLFYTATMAMVATPNPNPLQEVQPDGTTIRLFLKGHPISGAFMTDAASHPVVRDDQGWYVYASHQHEEMIGGRRKLLPSQRRVGVDDPESTTPPDFSTVWHSTDKKVFSTPFYQFSEVDNSEKVNIPDFTMNDLLCEGMERTSWCPNNPMSLGGLARTSDVMPANIGGTLNMIVVLVRFQDHESRNLPSRETYETLFNSDIEEPDIAPTGSVKNYYKTISYGKFSIQATVQDWVTIPETEEESSFGKHGLSSRFGKVATKALETMDARGVNWEDYDRDGDGLIDAIFIITSGYAAEGGGTDCVNNKEWGTHRIWSHRATVPNEPVYFHSADRKVRMASYATTSGLIGSCKERPCRIGVICHETGHLFGLPDMVGSVGSGVGVFDIMGQMWGVDGSQYHPGMMGAFSKQFVGWIKPQILKSSGVYTIRASANFEDAYRIDEGFPDGEYLLIENRQALYFDNLIPSTGLMIWHVDENLLDDYQSRPGYPGQEGWPLNGNHYQLAILQADGLYELEQGINNGGEGDLFSHTTGIFPGPGDKVYHPGQGSYPNTDTYSGGVFRSGITISDISNSSETMSFRITMSSPFSPQPTLLPTPTSGPTPLSTSDPTLRPTPGHTFQPTQDPTLRSMQDSTFQPSQDPTLRPTPSPTFQPTLEPTLRPTPGPTLQPSHGPTRQPTPGPTLRPTPGPTFQPTLEPSLRPTPGPTFQPTQDPTPRPTPGPTIRQTSYLTLQPTTSPTPLQTVAPILIPSRDLSLVPTVAPTHDPSSFPTEQPSKRSSKTPISRPTAAPTDETTPEATMYPRGIPTNEPSSSPTKPPSPGPTEMPRRSPTPFPNVKPTSKPTLIPSYLQSGTPTILDRETLDTGGTFFDVVGNRHDPNDTILPGSNLVAPSLSTTVLSPSLGPTVDHTSAGDLIPTISLSPTVNERSLPDSWSPVTFEKKSAVLSSSPSVFPWAHLVPSGIPTSMSPLLSKSSSVQSFRPSPSFPSGRPFLAMAPSSDSPQVATPSIVDHSASQREVTSEKPSTVPAQLESVVLNGVPSFSVPSAVPSDIPTSSPTEVRASSSKPSAPYSGRPTLSFAFFVLPSTIPSEHPNDRLSNFPSRSSQPSSSPSLLVPSVTPTDGTVPRTDLPSKFSSSTNPSARPTFPTSSSSSSSSNHLSDSPSSFSQVPSIAPTVKEFSREKVPTQSPYVAPNMKIANSLFAPMSSPTMLPTSLSTVFPISSSLPTLTNSSMMPSQLVPVLSDPGAPPILPGNISGRVLIDTDNDGVGDIPEPYSRVSIIDVSSKTILMMGGTDENGRYSFTSVPPGEYVIVQSNLPGYEDVSDFEGNITNSTIFVSLLPNKSSVNNDFVDKMATVPSAAPVKLKGDSPSNSPSNFLTNLPTTVPVTTGLPDVESNYTTHLATTQPAAPIVIPTPGTISGRIFIDTDNDGIGDIPSVYSRVSLIDVANNDILMMGGTNQDGRYTFSSVPPGKYAIMQSNLPGYEDVWDSAGNSTDSTIFLSLLPNGFSVDNDFVEKMTPVPSKVPVERNDSTLSNAPSAILKNSTIPSPVNDTGWSVDMFNSKTHFVPLATVAIPSGTISGQVFIDTNNDGIGDIPEMFSNIQLKSTSGDVQISVRTNEKGSFSFSNVPPGDYEIKHDNLPGYDDALDFAGNEKSSKIFVTLLKYHSSVDNNFLDRPRFRDGGGNRIRRRAQ